MPLSIPTTQQIKDRNLSNLETALSQTSPLNEKAFLRVLSAMEAINHTELYKYGAERSIQNLAITATGSDLDLIGVEYEVIRKPATSAVLDIEIGGTNGTTIPATTEFIGTANAERYFPDASAIIAGGVASLTVTAENTGIGGNLLVGDELTVTTPIPGANPSAEVTAIDTTGTDEESDDDYRIRVLDAIRTTGGGGNSADYRTWGQSVAGVERVYPYAGNSTDLETGSSTSYPPQRTVYVQADETIDPDGIPTSAILDAVRAAINNDPTTGEENVPLGINDDTLFVEAITRSTFNVTVTGLDVPADKVVDAQSAITTGVDTYFRSLFPFIEGLDFVSDKNEKITDVTISEVVQDIVSQYGGTADDVSFDKGAGTLTSYTLIPGELAKSGGVSFV